MKKLALCALVLCAAMIGCDKKGSHGGSTGTGGSSGGSSSHATSTGTGGASNAGTSADTIVMPKSSAPPATAPVGT